MGAEVIDGKRIAEEIRAELRPRIASLHTGAKTPGLAAVLVGDNPASALYVKMKARACEEVGLQSVIVKLPRETAQERFLAEVQRLNTDSSIHGILVQHPLPSQIPAIDAGSCV